MVYFSFSIGLGEKSQILCLGRFYVHGSCPCRTFYCTRIGAWVHAWLGPLGHQQRVCPHVQARPDLESASEMQPSMVHALEDLSCQPMVTAIARICQGRRGVRNWTTEASFHKHQVDQPTPEQKLFPEVPLEGGGRGQQPPVRGPGLQPPRAALTPTLDSF